MFGATGQAPSKAVRSSKQIAERLAHMQGQPPAPPMLGMIVQNDLGDERAGPPSIGHPRQEAAFAAAPGLSSLIVPAAVAELRYRLGVWSAAYLAPTLGAFEPDYRREVRPIQRVEPAMYGSNGHRCP